MCNMPQVFATLPDDDVAVWWWNIPLCWLHSSCGDLKTSPCAPDGVTDWAGAPSLSNQLSGSSLRLSGKGRTTTQAVSRRPGIAKARFRSHVGFVADEVAFRQKTCRFHCANAPCSAVVDCIWHYQSPASLNDKQRIKIDSYLWKQVSRLWAGFSWHRIQCTYVNVLWWPLLHVSTRQVQLFGDGLNNCWRQICGSLNSRQTSRMGQNFGVDSGRGGGATWKTYA